MATEFVVEITSSEPIQWRCLHSGPLTPETLDRPEPHPQVPWDRLRTRNIRFLRKLIECYGGCAVVARDGECIVGQLRFYPRAICELAAPGPGLCLQQTYPNGPADHFASMDFPPIDAMSDKTLFVHCLMTGSPQCRDNPYQRKGLGSRMVRTLVDWARHRGWQAIETHTHADLPCLYAVTGSAGRSFWEKLGFAVTETIVEPAFDTDPPDAFTSAMLAEAAESGLDAAMAMQRYTMRLELA